MNQDTQKLVALSCPSVDLRDRAADRFCDVVPLVVPADLKRLTDEGFLESQAVLVDGQAHYVFWFHLDACAGFHVNCAVRLLPGASVDHLFAAIEWCAMSRNAAFVRFNTDRLGLVKLSESFGYKPQAAVLLKKLR